MTERSAQASCSRRQRHPGGSSRSQYSVSCFQREAQLTQTYPDRLIGDAEPGLKSFEGDIGMFSDVGLQFLGVEFAPAPPTGFGGQRSRLGGSDIAVNRAPPEREAAGRLGFGAPVVDKSDHPLPQIQGISFHIRKPVGQRIIVNLNCCILPPATPCPDNFGPPG